MVRRLVSHKQVMEQSANMLEIPPLSPAYPVIKPGKIKKDGRLSEQGQRKKKQAVEEQETLPVQHIDEIA